MSLPPGWCLSLLLLRMHLVCHWSVSWLKMDGWHKSPAMHCKDWKIVTLCPCLGLGCSHFAPYCYYSTKSFPFARQHFTPDLDKYGPCEAEEMKGNTLGLLFFKVFFSKHRPERQELGEWTWPPVMRDTQETPRRLHWIDTHRYQKTQPDKGTSQLPMLQRTKFHEL